jgi:hypothetical protein
MSGFKKLSEFDDKIKLIETALKAGDIKQSLLLTDDLKSELKLEKKKVAGEEKTKITYVCSSCPLKCKLITKYDLSKKIVSTCLQTETEGDAAFIEVERQTET